MLDLYLDLVVPDILKENFDSTNEVALLIGETYQLECTGNYLKLIWTRKKMGISVWILKNKINWSSYIC